MNMSEAEARLEIGLLNTKIADFDEIDFAVMLTNAGLPQEIVTRLGTLSSYTHPIGGHVIEIGKIILMKIWDFIKAHPNLAVGIAIGAALGALTQLIPFIGSIISSILTPLLAFLGGLAGHHLDKRQQGIVVEYGIVTIAEDLITLAKEFFLLFASITNALVGYLVMPRDECLEG